MGISASQLERHIRQAAAVSANVFVNTHAAQRMRQRHINLSMVFEALTRGTLDGEPEPDMKHPGVKCRVQRYVAGVHVAVVVAVEYPSPELAVVTVFDVQKD